MSRRAQLTAPDAAERLSRLNRVVSIESHSQGGTGTLTKAVLGTAAAMEGRGQSADEGLDLGRGFHCQRERRGEIEEALFLR